MAPFRSSRSNRHLQHENAPRARGGVGGPIDHDPTEGLPVKKWQLADVTIKQVEKEDEGDEAKAGSVNPDYPWQELPLPKDFHQLPSHSQEILRRARLGNTRVRPAIYNSATGTYTAAPAHNPTVLKSKHLATSTVPVVASAIGTPPAEVDIMEDDAEADVTAQPKPTLEEDRTFTVRKWAPVPAAEADKRPEPKYLADRRPGLRNIYGYEQVVNVTAGNGNGVMTSTTLGAVANAAGEEISSTGLELSSVGGIGMGISASAPLPVEPSRKRGPPPPPKRKKKGGVGRRKKVLLDPVAGEQQRPKVAGLDGTTEGPGMSSSAGVGIKVEDVDGGVRDGEDDEGSGSDDGDEGSEEGEIDEGDGDVTMTTAEVPALEMKEPEAHNAVEPGTTGIRSDEIMPDVEAVQAEAEAQAQAEAEPETEPEAITTVPDILAAPVEEAAVQLTSRLLEDPAEEAVPVPLPEPAESPHPASPIEVEDEENSTILAAPVPSPPRPPPAVTTESTIPDEANLPAPVDAEPQAAASAAAVSGEGEGEVDLLGFLDRAVEGMQGANADANADANAATQHAAEEHPTGTSTE